MAIYIYFLIWDIAVVCSSVGCAFSSGQHVQAILAAGLVELVVEIASVVKIYKRKRDE